MLEAGVDLLPKPLLIENMSQDKIFQLSSLSNYDVYYCADVRKNFSLDQAKFQTMVSGERGHSRQPHKEGKTAEMKMHGILAGNELMNYTDTAGCISRRIVEFHFSEKVIDRDTTLKDKLLLERPVFLLKCNLAYQAKVREVGKHGLWDVLPEYFQLRKRVIEEDLNPIAAFLNRSSDIVLNPNTRMPYDEFMRLYEKWVKRYQSSQKGLNVTPDVITPVFNKYAIHVGRYSFQWKEKTLNGQWLFGVGIPKP